MTTSLLAVDCLAVAEDAARGVAGMLLDGFRSRPEIENKVDLHDMVTEYDRASEASIRAAISSAFPTSAIVGEEDGAQGDSDLVWYVDPIDGTSNFARGIPFWCVSIAAAQDGRVVAGVIFDPVHGDMFRADDRGAWRGDEPLTATGREREEQGTLLTAFPTPADLRDDREAGLRGLGDLVDRYAAVRNMTSGALCLAHVAAGWADVTFNFGTSPWDVAAGSHILRQAGGTYRTFDAGRQMPADGDFLRPHYVGAVRGADVQTIERILVEGPAARAGGR